jgi:hypothetical protein
MRSGSSSAGCSSSGQLRECVEVRIRSVSSDVAVFLCPGETDPVAQLDASPTKCGGTNDGPFTTTNHRFDGSSRLPNRPNSVGFTVSVRAPTGGSGSLAASAHHPWGKD